MQQGPPAAPPAPAEAAPVGSPMSAPTAQEGNKTMASVSIQAAMKLLQNAMPHYGLGSDEGRALLDVLKKLAIQFGAPTEVNHLVPAEIQSLVRSIQQGTPAQMPAPQE